MPFGTNNLTTTPRLEYICIRDAFVLDSRCLNTRTAHIRAAFVPHSCRHSEQNSVNTRVARTSHQHQYALGPERPYWGRTHFRAARTCTGTFNAVVLLVGQVGYHHHVETEVARITWVPTCSTQPRKSFTRARTSGAPDGTGCRTDGNTAQTHSAERQSSRRIHACIACNPG